MASSSSSTTPFEPIAIVGMGMRLPGAVRDAESFWDLLSSGRSGHGPVPASRYDSETWHSPRGRINHVATRHGYFLDDDLARSVDLGFWSMGPHEAATLEPGARLLLEVVYEALETSGARANSSGGGDGWRGSDTGVYVGTMGSDWTALESCDGQTQHAVRADVYGDYILANRASYEFDFRGPSVVVRTACSSSLVALHQACQDLQRGVCSAAVVAGVNVILSPRETAVMSAQGVLSPSGTCRTFDADADGYGRGEGVSAVYIKRLADALRDGDPVRSVIRSAVVGNDGHGSGKGMLAPNPAAHERLMRMAYRVAGISDGEVWRTAMVECHGTGTAVGDPLETSAVANIWGDSGGIYIGSVKPNIGHGEGSSGISSVIKMTLALEHKTIPPNINFKRPNPAIPFESKNLMVPTKSMPWPSDREERVSINCFGIGGTNAHVILESAACAGVKTQPVHSGSDPTESTMPSSRLRLLPFSTKRQDSLAKAVENINQYLERHPTRLDDVAHTLSARRTMHPWRAFHVAGPGGSSSSAALIPATCTLPPQGGKQKQAVCWVFTGQGAQWAQMGKQLIDQEQLVSRCIDHLDNVLKGLPDPPAWTIRGEIMKPKDTSRLYEAEISQPCLAAIQIAIVDLLRSWGSRPAAIVGHSSGETAAAYAAGALTAEQAIVLNYHRGQITPAIKATHKGSMAAVGLSRAEVQPFLRTGVIIGCENSPANVTLSGDAEVLQDIMTDIQAARPDTLIRQLRVECGFHSAHMQTAVPDFTRRISEVAREAGKPVVPFYSSVSGDLHEDLAALYWVSNLVHPVLFSQAVQSLLRDVEDPVFVEIGPHAALAGPVRQILQKCFGSSSRSSAMPYVPTLVRGQDGHVNLLETAGRLWQHGAGDIDLDVVNNKHHISNNDGSRRMVLTDLPAYPWHHDAAYWTESRLTREWRFRRFAHHELLGLRVADCGDAAPTWRNVLRVSDVGWLADHRVAGDVWLPGAGFVAMVGEAVRQLAASSAGKWKSPSGYSVKEVVFENALVLADDDVVELITSLVRIRQSGGGKRRQPSGGGVGVGTSKTRYAFTISSIADDGVATEHVYGECCTGRWEGEDSDDDLATDMTAAPSHGVFANTHHHHHHHHQQLQLPRQVSPAAFYKLWNKHGGLQYGPRFRGCMADVSADVTERRARATITHVQQQPGDDEAEDLPSNGAEGIVDGNLYALHPTAIDTSTVLCMIAECCGLPRRFVDTGIPQSIGAMYVAGDPGRQQQQQAVQVEAQVFEDGTSGITGVDMDGRVVLEISGFRVEKTGQLGGKPGDDNPHGGAVIEWMPDLGFMDTEDLVNVLQGQPTGPGQLLAQLATLCCQLLDQRQRDALKQQRGLLEYKAWLDITISEFGEVKESEPAEGSDSDSFIEVEAADMKLVAVRDLTSKIHDEYKYTPESALATMMLDTILTNADSAADRREDNPALPQRLLSNIIWDLVDEVTLPRDLIDMLVFKTPRLRILDIYVGSDSVRKEPPAYLTSLHEAGRLYGTYVHAYSEGGGISELSLSGETAAVATRVTNVNGIDFSSVRVDLDLNFAGQQLAAESFDLVMVTDLSGGGAHRLSSVDNTKLFANIHKLLDVDGCLAVRELQPESPLLQALQLRGAHEHVARREESSAAVVVSARNQGVSKQTMIAAGFTHVTITPWPAAVDLAPDAIRETSLCSYSIARPAPCDESQSSTAPALRVLCRDLHGETTRRALGRLRAEGFSDIQVVALGTPLAAGSGGKERLALCLLDLDGPFLYSASEAEFEGLKQSLSLSLSSEAVSREQEQWQQIQNNAEGLETVTIAGTEKPYIADAGSNKDDCRGILWVTGASQMHCTSNPNYALTLGFTRGLHRETGDEIITLEVDSFDLSDDADYVSGFESLDVGDNGSEKVGNITRTYGRSTWSAVGDVLRSMDPRARSLQTKKQECPPPLEREYVLSDGLIHISRFRETRLVPELEQLNTTESAHGEVTGLQSTENKNLNAVENAGFKVYPDRTYVLVGGLGGLGQSTARLLADRGARHFMFFSRSAEDFALRNPEFVSEMHGYAGCVVEFVSGDIASVRDVERMAAVLASPCWPALGGVFNAAMVLADGMLADMTYDQWQAALKPKVEGTWNLHKVLFASRLRGGKGGGANPSSLDKAVDKVQLMTDADDPKTHPHAPTVEVALGAFLFLFSSLSGVAHMLGQANYAAANSFLDAFAQYHAHTVAPGYSAAAVLDIGAMADVGVLAREGDRLDRFRGQDWVRLLGEGEFLEAMEVVLGRQSCSADQGAWGGAIRRYVSPVQMVIGLGSPSNAKGAPAATATRMPPPTTASHLHTGVAWHKDARFALHAAVAAAADAASNNKITTRDEQRQQGLASTSPDAQVPSENSSSDRKSRREDALRQFLARIRSATDGERAARYLKTPGVALFLARVIRRAIAELRGISDDTTDDDADDLDDEYYYQSTINGAAETTKQTALPAAIAAAVSSAREKEESLTDLGVDSLVMVELRTWLRQKLGASLSVAEIRRAGGGGVHALAATVARKLAAAVA